MKKDLYTLNTDNEFQQLIRPLTSEERKQLEANIVADGCRDPITVWNGIIIDGHNRYEICHKHNIPFNIHKMNFDSREDVIQWICANQLGRRNISEEARKFLIGKQYETEKVINARRNEMGYNQYKKADKKVPYGKVVADIEKAPSFSSHKTAIRIAEENHVSEGTVQKYGFYSRAIDAIDKKSPKMVAKILSGKYKISYNNIMELAKLSADEIERIYERIEQKEQSYVPYSNSRQVFIEERKGANETRFKPEKLEGTTVKDMPVFDPDAEISSLRLTVPSWTSSIERVMNKTDFKKTTKSARKSLIDVLLIMQHKILELLSKLKED